MTLSELNPVVLFQIFVYPNKSWFCGAILLYAIFYFFAARTDKKSTAVVAIGIATIIYIIWYVTRIDFSYFGLENMGSGGLCRVSFYFICMIVGLLYKEDGIKRIFKRMNPFVLGILGIAAYGVGLGLKIIMSRVTILFTIQFSVQILTLMGAVLLFTAFVNAESYFRRWKVVGNVAKWLADRSWEIYLTQTLVIPLMVAFVFPIGAVLAIVITFVAAVVLHQIMEGITYITDRYLWSRGR